MSGLLNVGTRALLANQTALQTAGNNIANVNTPGYSRQNVTLEAVLGQNIGGGYVGKGVNVAGIERTYNSFLTKQAAMTQSVASMDATRATRMLQLEDLFPSGTAGIGSSLNDLLNGFSDAAASPGDLTARSVVLAKADALAMRFRDASQQLDDLAAGTRQELTDSVKTINSLAARIATLNEQIARVASGTAMPNDLLDQRDQLIQDLNGYVQTTTVPAADGTLGVFVGSQPLVLGTRTSTVSLAGNDYNDVSQLKLSINNGGLATTLDENLLGGGSVVGLMRFNNVDLVDGRNMLGRMALAVTTAMNAQHRLGIDQDGNAGGDFFTAQAIPQGLAATSNVGTANVSTVVADPSAMVASNYQLRFGAGGTVQVTRLSDGQSSNFGSLPATVDGLTFSATAGAQPGDSFLVRPFAAAAATIQTAFTSGRNLAVASPVEAQAGTANTGTLAVQGVQATQANANLTATVTLTFTGAGTFDVTGTGTGNPTGVAYASGQPISYNGWEVTLKGTPQPGDTITVQVSTPGFRALDGGNANALMSLRDATMFDGASMADGYAGLIAQIGIRSQGVQYAAQVSGNIASTAASEKSAVSGVNLDEEAAKLLQFQQAYQASAKMIQIAQSIFDTLINGLGR